MMSRFFWKSCEKSWRRITAAWIWRCGRSDGKELEEAVKKEPFSYTCIFLDVEMPGMNGFETAKALRDAGCQAPVILLTSHREYAPEGYEVGAFRFLTKPLEKISCIVRWRQWKMRKGTGGVCWSARAEENSIFR